MQPLAEVGEDMPINRFYRSTTLAKAVERTQEEKMTPKENINHTADCTEELLELRKIADMRDAYERSGKELERWEEEQFEEEQSILRIVQELEASEGIEAEDVEQLAQMREGFGQNKRERERMLEDWQESYRKKTVEWDEEESIWRTKYQQKQEGEN